MTRADIYATALVLLVLAGAYWTGHEQDARRQELGHLEARLDIEHRERDELARRLSEVEGHVEALYDLDDSQATGIQLLEQDLTELIEGRKAREAWPAQSFAMGLEVGE